ncbi:unannotated protein [freshwater metagenome]|uniref:Unannotated protein n=1 Tax=freshwater metagenome TaxID=449393 RepID=A0A6J6EQ28_9ZZZZ
MGHINRGDPKPSLNSEKLTARFHAQFGVEVAQWFVKEEHGWFPNDRSANSNALLLATAQIFGLALREVTKPEGFRDLLSAFAGVCAIGVGGPKREGDVF